MAKREWTNQCTSDSTRSNRVTSEISAMSNIANDASGSISSTSIYFKAWVPDDNQNAAQVTAYKDDYYAPVEGFNSNDDQTAIVTCVQDAECQSGNGQGGVSYAHTVWDGATDTGTINLCDPWFDNTNFPSTSDMLSNCDETQRTVEEFETPAATLLHEFLHLGVCDNIQAPFSSSDETYGAVPCYDLARNDGDAALENADNWMLVTIGTYWDKTCSRRILTGIPAIDPPTTTATATATATTAGTQATSVAPPPPPPAPYATGTCSFHLTETQDCESMTSNLYGSVLMVDNNKATIGQTVIDADHPIGYPINVGSSYSFDSKLPNPLVITGEHDHDYVQFTYGSLSWQSTTPNGGGTCAGNVGDWNPKDGPVCGLRIGDQNAVFLSLLSENLCSLDVDGLIR